MTHKVSGLEVATIKFYYFRFGGTIQIPGTLDLYISRRGHEVLLRRSESNIATASFSRLKRNTELNFEDSRFLLEPAPSVARGAFVLKTGPKGAEREVGRVIRNGFFRWSDEINLQEWVPVEAASFVYWCALWHYRRCYIISCLCIGLSVIVVGQLVRLLFISIQ